MSVNDVNLRTYPSTYFEALALIYVEKNITEEMSPSDVYDLYQTALTEIKHRYQEDKGPTFSF